MIHLAYADDHLAVRKGIISLLSDLGGIAVDIDASNGRELLSKLRSAKVLPSICMLDISMPDMDGFDTIMAIRAEWPDMKVLVITAFMVEHYIIRMIRYGANGYLLKNCNPLEIKTALQSIQARGYYHSDLVPSAWSNAVRADKCKLPELTGIESRILKYCCTDLSYEEIGAQLKITKRSVEGHRDAIFKKLEIHSRVSLALYAIRLGLVSIEHFKKN